jgi:hypothetical protein
LSGTKSSLLNDILLIKLVTSNLRTEVNESIVCDLKPCWSKSISIKIGSNVVSIAECDVGRSIPTLELSGIILIEVNNFLFIFDSWLIIECLWHDHHHSFEWRVAVHDEHLNQLVESIRVTTASVDDWHDLLNLLLQDWGFVGSFTGFLPIQVTQVGVDLAIM